MRTESIPVTYITKFIGLPTWCSGQDFSILFVTNLDENNQLYNKQLTKDVDYILGPDKDRMLFTPGWIITLNANVQSFLNVGLQHFDGLQMSLHISDVPKPGMEV